MNNQKREDIIKEHYKYVTHNSNGKVLVRIFKPYDMGDLPVDLIIVDAVTHRVHKGTPYQKEEWSCIDPNYGACWAAHVVLHRYGMVCDYYVCALLIRPYSEEALNEFLSGDPMDETERLKEMFDSRILDQSVAHHQRKYTIEHNKKVSLWHMDAERLSWIENRLYQEKIMERAKTLRPIGEPKGCGGMRFWVDGGQIHNSCYLWDMKKLRPTGHLTKLGTIVTYHKCSYFFAKPSVDECVYQCPFDEATAFMVTRIGSFNHEIDRLECETTYYKGKIPKEILNREIEW